MPFNIATSIHIRKIIRKHWHIVSHIPGCQQPLVIGYKRAKTICDVLVRSDLSNQFRSQTQPQGDFKCHNCSVCNNCMELKEFVLEPYLKNYCLPHLLTCATKNVVYIRFCCCPKCYIGSSTQAVRVHLMENRLRLKNKVCDMPIVEHCILHDHHFENLKCFVIYKYERRGHTEWMWKNFYWLKKNTGLINCIHCAWTWNLICHAIFELNELWT